MLSEKLIEKRIQKNLTTRRLSELSGVNLKEYELMENGIIRKMSIETFNKLKDILSLNKAFYNSYVSPYKDLRVLGVIRNSLGYSLGDVSKKTGLYRMQIYSIEKGESKKISKEVFDKLDMAYNIVDKQNYDHLLIHTSYSKMKFICPEKFSEEVFKKRTALKLSQETLGMISDVNFTLISKIENERKPIKVDTAYKLMNALEFTEEEKKKYIKK